jgi:putative oxidoreductase
MTTTVTARKTSVKTIGFWILKILLSISFLGAGGAKLAGLPAMVSEFDIVGLGQWFRYLTAALEIIGAITLLAPRTTPIGALLLAVVCIGAFFAQLLALHGDVVHTVIMAAVLFAIAWAGRAANAQSGEA